MDEYDGRQFVGIDLHRQRSVIVRQSESGEQLSAVRIVNDPVALELQLEAAGARSIASKDVQPLGDDIIDSVTNPTSKFTAAIHIYGGDFFAAHRSEWDSDTLS